MLAHCAEYLDSVGDNSLNLAATISALNAYMLTGEREVPGLGGRVRQRLEGAHGGQPAATSRPTSASTASPAANTTASGGRAPTAGTSPSSTARLEQIAHRNYFTVRPWPGFGNALLLTGDQAYVDVLRRQMDNIYAQKKVENGQSPAPADVRRSARLQVRRAAQAGTTTPTTSSPTG